MTATLSTARDQVEIHLQDLTNLIWSTTTIDEAMRAALAELGNAYGASLSLEGLDGALLTTYDELDHNTLLVGTVAYALRFRLVDKIDLASPTRVENQVLLKHAALQMAMFQSLLTQVRLRRFAVSGDCPYSQWEWDEGRTFS
jgi:hypothetical protein